MLTCPQPGTATQDAQKHRQRKQAICKQRVGLVRGGRAAARYFSNFYIRREVRVLFRDHFWRHRYQMNGEGGVAALQLDNMMWCHLLVVAVKFNPSMVPGCDEMPGRRPCLCGKLSCCYGWILCIVHANMRRNLNSQHPTPNTPVACQLLLFDFAQRGLLPCHVQQARVLPYTCARVR